MAALKKLKQQYPSGLLTISDMEAVYMMTGSDGEPEEDEEIGEVRWAEDEGEQHE